MPEDLAVARMTRKNRICPSSIMVTFCQKGTVNTATNKVHFGPLIYSFIKDSNVSLGNLHYKCGIVSYPYVSFVVQ